MTLDHYRIEELMAAEALGGLDDGDRAFLDRERAAHGACTTCGSIEAGFAETAGRLGFALTPEPIDDDMVDRIIAATARPPVAADLETPRDELSARRSRRPWAWAAVAAAAGAVMVLAVVTLTPRTTQVTEATSSQRVVAFTGTSEGTLAMAFTPGETGAVFWGSGLPDPSPGDVYEIWMIEDGAAVSGGCVTPVDGVIALHVDANIGTTDTMAVTSEAADCPTAPTNEPLLLADLTTIV
ncbi:MAG: anti-sigma factor [Actinomycetota bacterium]|nr:anti-sigma factor [Actinomycetota bacterium]